MTDYKTHDNKLWKRMSFKGNKVWVAMNDDKSFFEKDNKLQIKYGLKQDYEYLIKKENIKPVTQAIPKEKRNKPEKNIPRKKIKNHKQINSDKNVINIFTESGGENTSLRNSKPFIHGSL